MTHVPPSRYSSASITLAPCPDATRAARMPPDPPPITNKSTSNPASREGADTLAADIDTPRGSCNKSVSLKSASNPFCAAGRNACADRIVRARAGANIHLDPLSLRIRMAESVAHTPPLRTRGIVFWTFGSAHPSDDQRGRAASRLLLGRERALG